MNTILTSLSALETMPPFEIVSASACASQTAGQTGPHWAPHWAFIAARHLLGLPVEEAISAILADTGELSGTDRAWMFEYDEGLLRFRNTHEWCRTRVPSYVHDLQDAPVTMIAWLHQSLVEGKAVLIHDVSRLPRTARSLQVEMTRQDDKSVLCVPVFHEGRLRACIGFDATRDIHRWTALQAHELFQCAELIALARYGGRSTRTSLATRPEDSGAFVPMIYLRIHGGVRGVVLDEIMGLRSSKDYTQIWLANGTSVTDLRPLSVWLGLLPKKSFLRIHRTAVVSLQHIRHVDRNAGPRRDSWEVQLRMINQRWAVSRPYRQELRTRLGI